MIVNEDVFKAYGFTFEDVMALNSLLTILGYMNRVPEFCNEVMQNGLPSMKEVGICYHERQIEILKNTP